MSVGAPIVTLPPFDFERRRRQPRFYPFDAFPATVFSTGGGVTAGLTAPVLGIATNGNANTCLELGEFFAGFSTNWYTDAAKGFWARPLRAAVNIVIGTSVNPNANSLAGLEIGAHRNVFPYTVSFLPFIQLRAKLSTLTWELVYAKGDGFTADQIVTLTGVSNPALDAQSRRLEINYTPGVSIVALVNGVVGASVAFNANFPRTTGLADTGAAVLASQGNNAGDSTTAYFHNMEAETIGAP